MKAIEVTIQNLIGSGMDPKTENNPYLGFVYTSFQERATKVSHGNTARHALEHGDEVRSPSRAGVGRGRSRRCRGRERALLRGAAFVAPTGHGPLGPCPHPPPLQLLAKMCGSIASDEGRHEIAYQRIVEKLFEVDPDGAVLAFADMMRKQIVMPAHLMDDGQHPATNSGRNLFAVRRRAPACLHGCVHALPCGAAWRHAVVCSAILRRAAPCKRAPLCQPRS